MTTQVVQLYTDPGHGWLRVKRTQLAELGITHKITPFSYQRGQWVYLEEDCDASLFLDTVRAKTGSYPMCVTHNSRTKPSKIRGYESYCCVAEVA